MSSLVILPSDLTTKVFYGWLCQEFKPELRSHPLCFGYLLKLYDRHFVGYLPSVVASSSSGGGCYKGDLVCEKDKLGYEAIATLHTQMDDDANGDIDIEESAEVECSLNLQYSSI